MKRPEDPRKKIYPKFVSCEITFSVKCSACGKIFKGKAGEEKKVLGVLWEHIGDEHI